MQQVNVARDFLAQPEPAGRPRRRGRDLAIAGQPRGLHGDGIMPGRRRASASTCSGSTLSSRFSPPVNLRKSQCQCMCSHECRVGWRHRHRGRRHHRATSSWLVHRMQRADMIAARSRTERRDAYTGFLKSAEDSLHRFQWIAKGRVPPGGSMKREERQTTSTTAK
jgi:hypothetical protein